MSSTSDSEIIKYTRLAGLTVRFTGTQVQHVRQLDNQVHRYSRSDSWIIKYTGTAGLTVGSSSTQDQKV